MEHPNKNEISTEDTLAITDTIALTISHPLYIFFPDHIEALHKIKKQELQPFNAINLLFIPVYTMFVESVLSELFDEYLEQSKSQSSDDLGKRLVDSMSQALKKASWRNYQDLFYTVFGKRMNEVIPDDSVKAIVALFILRNQAIHGKQVSYTIQNAGDDDELAYLDGHYKSLNSFFLEKNLITREDLSSFTFLNDRILDYFFSNIIIFVTSLNEKIVKPNKLRMDLLLDPHVLQRLSSIPIKD